MRATDIIKKIDAGKIIEIKNTFNLTFIEGKRLTDYADELERYIAALQAESKEKEEEKDEPKAE